MRGQISDDSIPHDQAVEVHVEYLAFWTHDFFGVADGMVMSIDAGTVTPARDGSFEIEVPDFSAQSSRGEGTFQLTLRQRKGGKMIARLKPGDEDGKAFGLEVRSDYPQVIQFTGEKQ
ncbi:MAG: hypothetical protein ABSG51_06735 [Terracidiphilus sp.]